MKKRLARSRSDRKLAGVIGGLSRYVGIDSTILRVIFIILLIPTGFFPLAVVYGLLAFVLPHEEEAIR
ncbi:MULTISPECIES: PspC domain-containing protein [Bacillaceae]|jgi:phage shock protein C|uniref:PspC domain-containing protein n=3 Tax=Rossellomorea TaxID=2837508 RepID=A0ACD4C519_9BACI|nr:MULTISPECIES: PspC domain-containing protein [Bacillaceae]PFG04711.1 phage shock protein C (PspC) family protein [Bacillus sp. es.034]QHE63150.1 PspC domain-containing protein [Rossellomorea vietnamensis]UTE79569.1 PspC domain-containing protein [Rossellomorea sp. KS-H15a]UXH43494.1 PspC domain-containing protein [Rossellomorea vietnamensis]WGG45183.1 PspC domain-containing protein [Rossellomorea sp. DA94]